MEFNRSYFFDNKTELIKECSYNCKYCEGNPNYCLECNYENYYYPMYNKKELCMKNPLGYYLDKQNMVFKKCIENCLKCEDNNSCEICDEFSTLIKSKKKCFFCGKGKFYDEELKKCKECIEIGNCLTCNYKGCYECLDNFEFKPYKINNLHSSGSEKMGIYNNYNYKYKYKYNNIYDIFNNYTVNY
jgi:hypothetical protein